MDEVDARRLERHGRRIEELNLWRNALESPVGAWRFVAENGKVTKLAVGDFWPEAALPANLSAEATVPEAWVGSPVELELWLGGEGFVRLSTGLSGGLNPYHKSFPVAEKARGGERIGVEAEVVPRGPFGTNVAEPRIGRAALVVPETDLRALHRDLALIAEVCGQLGGHEAVPHLLDAIEEAFAGLAPSWPTGTDVALTRHLQSFAETTDGGPWSLPPAPQEVEPLPEETRRAVRGAREKLAARLEGLKAEYPPVGRVALTGHAHLDLAWLWPVSETLRKGRRTFASVLSLMDRYEDFVFNQSSAQLYDWIESEAPDLFEGVRKRVEEGRWEPVGGMWVEPDCQIPSGESIARQLLHGQRYFESRFGRRSKVAWLPDTFGFSPALPQILKGAGIEGFFTYKLNWSEANKFPHDLYEWEGLDGSTVVAHDFDNPGQDYNGNLRPLDLYGTWKNFEGKRRHPETLFSFGWGDGGGGPTEEMLENFDRLKSFPAMPRLRMAMVEDFFDSLPAEGLPKWVGELYLELHRGTLTTQARVKKLNREAEHRLLEAEVLLTLAALRGAAYPEAELESAWKTLLLNQFHDILPGTSIREVYDVTRKELENVVETAKNLRDGSLDGPDGAGAGLLVANASLHPRPLTVYLRGGMEGGSLPAQKTDDGGLLVHVPEREVPGLGWTSPRDGGEPASPNVPRVGVEVSGETTVIENGLLRVEVGADGTLHRVFDEEAGREVLSGRGNGLWAYTDRPRNWEAWDIEEGYEGEAEEILAVEGVEVTEDGPLRASVRVTRLWRGSEISQTYRLLSGSRRLDVETRVDWRERRVLLRALFPVNVRSHEATSETMFGAQRRPTHQNTTWDATRFETSAHRFLDISEPGYGVALLNDGKYGHSARGNVLGLTLLRGPVYPDPLADQGEHRFTYSIYPHAGDWTEAGVAREAFALNSPLIPVKAKEGEPSEYSFVVAEGLEVALAALKAAEDGRGEILRLYEPHGARGECRLNFPGGLQSAEKTNLLEDGGESLEVREDGLSLELRPFEVVSLRLEAGRG
ncbi:alpha-mannosidase [Rubrobacter tropicus]|uniref:Alpha-mannosidase n=1 Tax=Rubrobacter tropicus TaxID=2653851 RepID=A0A6G8QAL6_9ACTN|nr:alpha-mannosidase [Rubrobacter tropicus]QIN83516.1 alpha-mannosidase [Rubrobacter tropicus]